MKAFFRRLKEGTEHLNYGREIIARWAGEKLAGVPPSTSLHVLDLGCGAGDDLDSIRERLQGRDITLFGIEANDGNAACARERGILVASLDLERCTFPYPDASIDLIVANQIIEHAKELFWIFSECSRVLTPGGYMIIGVPNLASLHSRILLFFGDQPSSIELMGPHVRGITASGFRRFIEADNIFRLENVNGANFYPLPAWLSRPVSTVFPRLSVSLFFLVRKIHPTRNFMDVLKTRFFETNFYQGS